MKIGVPGRVAGRTPTEADEPISRDNPPTATRIATPLQHSLSHESDAAKGRAALRGDLNDAKRALVLLLLDLGVP